MKKKLEKAGRTRTLFDFGMKRTKDILQQPAQPKASSSISTSLIVPLPIIATVHLSQGNSSEVVQLESVKVDFSYLNISDIRPEPKRSPQETRGHDSDEPQNYNMPCSANEESDQESKNSMNETTDKEDNEQPHATAACAGQSIPGLTPADIPSGSTQGGHGSTCCLSPLTACFL